MIGPVVTSEMVRNAVIETVKKWMPAYLSEVGHQNGYTRGDLPMFRSHTTPLTFDKMPEDQLPALLVVVPGFLEPPERNGDKYDATWDVTVGTINASKDRDSTQKLVDTSLVALAALFVQHPSLGGFASGVDWLDMDAGEIDFDASRTIAGGTISLGVKVENILDLSQGLITPPVDPNGVFDEWPTVEETFVATQGAPSA